MDLVPLALVDDRPEGDLGRVRVADRQVRRLLAQPLDKAGAVQLLDAILAGAPAS